MLLSSAPAGRGRDESTLMQRWSSRRDETSVVHTVRRSNARPAPTVWLASDRWGQMSLDRQLNRLGRTLHYLSPVRWCIEGLTAGRSSVSRLRLRIAVNSILRPSLHHQRTRVYRHADALAPLTIQGSPKSNPRGKFDIWNCGNFFSQNL